MMGLKGKVAVVTGGGSGIGQAIAMRLAQEQALVVVADIDVRAGQETVDKISHDRTQAVFVKADVSDGTSVKSLMQQAVDKFGGLDVAVNNAGTAGPNMPIADYEEEEFDRIIRINLKGVFLCMKYEIPHMTKRGGGAILNISSVAGLKAMPRWCAYGASKAGVISITRTAALEVAPLGIRVNVIAPGMFLTPLVQRTTDDQTREMTRAFTPLNRIGKLEEIGAAAAWLCSEQASYTTGVTFPVDGGLSA